MDNRILILPRIRFGNKRLDGFEVMGVIFLTLLLALFATFVITYGIHRAKWAHTPPPKVITKVIHENGLTYAQNQFIQQCESSKKDINPNDENQPLIHGIPNVTVNPWTCTYGQ